LGAPQLDVAALRSQSEALKAAVLAAVPAQDFELTYRYQALPLLAGRAGEAGVEALAQHPDVVEVAIDGQGSAALGESVPLIFANEAHDGGLTGEGVIVAVLDSGVDTDHPDLQGDIAYEACFLPGSGCPAGAHPAEDDNGHGTNVAGIITSAGTVAPVGVAPDAQIAAYKILNASGFGSFSDWVAALDDIAANHPEVDFVNMSLQSPFACPSSALETAIATLRQNGVLTFIAAGNHGIKQSFNIPACIDDGISVGASYDASLGSISGWKVNCTDAVTSADMITCWSDSDESLDLLAPGANVTSAGRFGVTSTFRGTSQASPHAAGVAALLLEAFPALDAGQIEARLEATGALLTDDLNDSDPMTNRTTPRVDARVALLADADDADVDGCSNEAEFGLDPSLGGQRNPLVPWDFYDTNGDQTIDLFEDIFSVAGAFGVSQGDPGYSTALDRSSVPPATDPWHVGPPDGVIDLFNDVFGVAAQFGHDCTPLP
ncbi:MAG: S8 family serine peptidase, partial [Dehalococcoidia bacterium]|nr:S8 family serine peptidase [Dehalococcoidia bacterium]